MLILAVDMSTDIGSLALTRDDTVLTSHHWPITRLGERDLFAELGNLLSGAGVSPAEIEAYAVGLGPGVFSGLRVSLTAMRALALPGNRPVWGTPTPPAIVDGLPACDQPTVIIGDARRERAWWQVVTPGNQGSPLEGDEAVHVSPFSELPGHLPPLARIASPDAHRLQELLTTLEAGHHPVIQERVFPAAVAVGQLALLTRTPAESPIYPHPAVVKQP